VYDAIWNESAGQIILICPKLFNLEKLLKAGELKLDGQKLNICKIRRRSRHDEVWLTPATKPGLLTISYENWHAKTKLSAMENVAFANLNCMVAISKDNELQWIRDWLTFHIKAHGLEGVVLFDNGSTRYSLADLENTLSGIDGLKAWRVVSAPFSYGPLGIKRHVARSKFLQSAVLNIARLRFLADAAAVLSIDVDELVYHREGLSIFEETKKTKLGYIPFQGNWAYSKSASEAMPRHRDHIFMGEQPKPCPFKYCVIPSGWSGRRSREVHGVYKKTINKFLAEAEFSYLHCWGINTHWKGRRMDDPSTTLKPNPAAVCLFEKILD
jgi:hypothetical protein